MEYIALISFLMLVVGWLVAPSGAVVAQYDGRAGSLDIATASVAD